MSAKYELSKLEAGLREVQVVELEEGQLLVADADGVLQPTTTTPGSAMWGAIGGDITDQTGGYTEVVRDSADLAPATARIAEELNHQYMLGYTPAKSPDGQYRRIRVKTRNSEQIVRARRGYIATTRRPS